MQGREVREREGRRNTEREIGREREQIDGGGVGRGERLRVGKEWVRKKRRRRERGRGE